MARGDCTPAQLSSLPGERDASSSPAVHSNDHHNLVVPKDRKDLRTPAGTGPGRDDGRRLHRATSEERQAAVFSLSRTKREE